MTKLSIKFQSLHSETMGADETEDIALTVQGDAPAGDYSLKAKQLFGKEGVFPTSFDVRISYVGRASLLSAGRLLLKKYRAGYLRRSSVAPMA